MSDMDTMEEKWRNVFKLVDIDKDGVVSAKDRDVCKNKFQSFAPQDSVQICANLDDFWDKLIFQGETPNWDQEITEDQFVAKLKDAFVKDKAGTRNRISDALKSLLTTADLDKSGIFTFEKFFRFHEAFNIGHDVIVRTTFTFIGPDGNDTCTFEQVHGFYHELFIGENKENFEALKTAYRAVGLL